MLLLGCLAFGAAGVFLLTMDFNRRTPQILVVDDFYRDPDAIRNHALSLEYRSDERYYKGRRAERMLLPHVREEFERLLGVNITDWVDQPANGAFQLTTHDDPLVYHSDRQDYAGAIYLAPDAPLDSGTSFWRNKSHGCRTPPESEEACRDVYSDYNLLHEDAWELVDRIGNVYNRAVLWNAKLIHSATSYPVTSERLAQLFFFSVR